MILLRQPPGSRVCGQTCVAMLADVDLDLAIAAVGKRGATGYQDLRRGLAAFGLTGEWHRALRGKIPPTEVIGVAGIGDDPPRSIVRLRGRPDHPDKKWGGHWVVLAAGSVWDPDPYGWPVTPLLEYTSLMQMQKTRFTSFMPVKGVRRCLLPAWSS